MKDKVEISDIEEDVTDKETTGVSAPIEEPKVKPEESSGVEETPEPEPKPAPKKSRRRKKSTAPKAPVVIQMQSSWPARLIIGGTPSGKGYTFERAGVILGIDPQDVDFILSRNRKIETHGRGCCGGEGERIYVQLV